MRFWSSISVPVLNSGKKMKIMENTVCAICHSFESEQLFVGQDYLHGNEGSFPVVQCKNCGLIYLNPRPSKDEISDYYPCKKATLMQIIRRASRKPGLVGEGNLFLLS